jgi:hypothetical protein
MQNSPSRDGSSVNRDFLSFKPTAIANELTMIFSELYQRIEPMEFLTHGKSKPGDKVRLKLLLLFIILLPFLTENVA